MRLAAPLRVLQELRHDQQTAVGPPTALHDERSEVGRGRAVAQPLGVVDQGPAVVGKVDARFGVLDDGTVLHVAAHLVAVDRLDLHDVFERPPPDDGVGAHPERRVVRRHPLVQDVLDVGGRSRETLDTRRGAPERRVGRLRHRDALVLGLLQKVDEPQTVVAQQQRVGVESEEIGRVGDDDVGLVRRTDPDQNGPFVGRVGVVATAQQPDVGVEVHRLVRLVRQRRVPLAFEGRGFDREDPHQATVKFQQSLAGGGGIGIQRGLESARGRIEVVGKSSDDLVDEERVDVVFVRPVVSERAQPHHGRDVLVAERIDGIRGNRAAQQPLVLVGQERFREPLARLGQSGLDVGGDAAGLVEPSLHDGISRERAVIEQQHDPQRRVLLQRCRPHRLAHDGRLFRVRGDEDRQPVVVSVGEVAVELPARRAHVTAEPPERSLAGDEVHQRRERQERYDRCVEDRLQRPENALVREHLRQDREDHVADPRGDRRADRDPRPHHLRGRRARVHGRERLAPLLGTPLRPSGRRQRCACTHPAYPSRVRGLRPHTTKAGRRMLGTRSVPAPRRYRPIPESCGFVG